MKLYYKIHDLTLCLEYNNQFPWVLHKLDYFKVHETIHNPNIHIKVGPFKIEVSQWENCDHKYFSNGKDIYFSNSWKGLHWKTAWFGLHSNQIKILFDFNIVGAFFFPWLMYLDWLLYWFVFKPCSELIWSRRNRYIIHASACAKNGRSMLFTGFGSGLKTSFAMKLVKQGYSFLGDDQILVDNNGLYCMPISLSTFSFRVGQLNDEYLTFFRLLRMIHFHYFPKKSNFEIAPYSPIGNIFVVIRSNISTANIYDISSDEAAHHTTYNCINETLVNIQGSQPIYAPFRALDIINPAFNHESMWEGLHKCLSRLYKNQACKKIEMKSSWDESYMDLLLKGFQR